MPKDFWYWLIIAIWVVLLVVGGYRSAPVAEQRTRTYWLGWGGDLILLLLFIILGLKLFPDPFGTLVK